MVEVNFDYLWLSAGFAAAAGIGAGFFCWLLLGFREFRHARSNQIDR
jgi:hypothetical protein